MIYQPKNIQPSAVAIDLTEDNTFSFILQTTDYIRDARLIIYDMNGAEKYNHNYFFDPTYNGEVVQLSLPANTEGLNNGEDYKWTVRLTSGQGIADNLSTYGLVNSVESSYILYLQPNQPIFFGDSIKIGSQTSAISSYDKETGRTEVASAFGVTVNKNDRYYIYTRDVDIYPENIFYARKKPVVSVLEAPTDITTKEYTFTGSYTQEDNISIMYHIFNLYVRDQNNNVQLLDTTGKVYSANLEYTYDSFRSGETYLLQMVTENQMGIVSTTDMYEFNVQYDIIEYIEAPSATLTKSGDAIVVSWASPIETEGKIVKQGILSGEVLRDSDIGSNKVTLERGQNFVAGDGIEFTSQDYNLKFNGISASTSGATLDYPKPIKAFGAYNLFNPSAETLRYLDGYTRNTSGEKVATEGRGMTEMYIKAYPNNTIYVRGFSSGPTKYLYFYDKNKNFISKSVGFTGTEYNTRTPNSCIYIDIEYPIEGNNFKEYQVAHVSKGYAPYGAFKISASNFTRYIYGDDDEPIRAFSEESITIVKNRTLRITKMWKKMVLNENSDITLVEDSDTCTVFEVKAPDIIAGSSTDWKYVISDYFTTINANDPNSIYIPLGDEGVFHIVCAPHVTLEALKAELNLKEPIVYYKTKTTTTKDLFFLPMELQGVRQYITVSSECDGRYELSYKYGGGSGGTQMSIGIVPSGVKQFNAIVSYDAGTGIATLKKPLEVALTKGDEYKFNAEIVMDRYLINVPYNGVNSLDVNGYKAVWENKNGLLDKQDSDIISLQFSPRDDFYESNYGYTPVSTLLETTDYDETQVGAFKIALDKENIIYLEPRTYGENNEIAKFRVVSAPTGKSNTTKSVYVQSLSGITQLDFPYLSIDGKDYLVKAKSLTEDSGLLLLEYEYETPAIWGFGTYITLNKGYYQKLYQGVSESFVLTTSGIPQIDKDYVWDDNATWDDTKFWTEGGTFTERICNHWWRAQISESGIRAEEIFPSN